MCRLKTGAANAFHRKRISGRARALNARKQKPEAGNIGNQARRGALNQLKRSS